MATNCLAALEIGCVNDNLTIKSARTKQRAVENFGPICSCKDDHAGIRLEAIHFHEQRIERLFSLIVDIADVYSPLSTDGVKFINEDNARRMIFGLLEQIAHTGGSHADKHLHKIAAADRKERHLGLTCHVTACVSSNRMVALRTDPQWNFMCSPAPVPSNANGCCVGGIANNSRN
jgi:hypothetical protein